MQPRNEKCCRLNELTSPSVNELTERLDIERTATGKMAAVLQRDELLSIDESVAIKE